MKIVRLLTSAVFFSLCLSLTARCGDAEKRAPKKDAVSRASVEIGAAVPAAPAQDTLVVVARLVEIPGTFAPNDLYNYVYIMKYRVLKVVRGSYEGREILVGHYNPRIPRKNIKDGMAQFARGNADKFEKGVTHTLVLIAPVDRVWKDAVEDEYVDSDLEKYYALKADVAKQ